ncbi:Putrescine importer PuuP [compost metagenome]
MGLISLMMTVLAFSAPVLVVAGFVPFVIGFAGATAPVAYIIAMVILLTFAVGFTTMSKHVTNPGAFYSYICKGLGKQVGLGSCFVAIGAYLGMSIGTYIFFGYIANDLISRIVGRALDHVYLFALVSIAVVGVLGYLRIELSARVLTFAMCGEIIIVSIFDICVLSSGGASGVSFQPFSFSEFLQGSFGLPIVFAATCYLGFEATAVFRDEVKNPERTVPVAAYLCVALIGVFFVVSTWALVLAYGAENAQAAANENFETLFVTAVGRYVGSVGENAVLVLIVSSAFACVLAVQNILSRYIYSLGVDGVVSPLLGRVHVKNGSPYLSSILVTVISFSIVVGWYFSEMDIAASYALLAGTGGFAVLILMCLTSISVVLFFMRNPGLSEASVVRRLWAPIAGALMLGYIIFNALTNFSHIVGDAGIKSTLALAVIVGLFVIGYLVASVYKKSKPTVYAKIGRQ